MEQTFFVNNKYKSEEVNNDDNKITFFTPTYNRHYLLHKIYDTLLNQTCKDFVWILVNDGSTDETNETAMELLHREEIPMLYISKTNGGKHSAFKLALEATNTRYFMCMDDDDLYSERAVAVLLEEWKKIELEKKEDIGAIRTLTLDSDTGTILSRPIVKDNQLGKRFDISTLDRIYKEHIIQENWTCYKTQALKKTNLFGPYWLCEQHKFFSEGIWQARFARKFKCRYYYVVLRTYQRVTTNSLTRAVKSRQHYMDMFINTELSLVENYDYIKYDKKKLLKNIILVSVLRHKLNIPFKELITHTDKGLLKISYYILYPVSFLIRKPVVPSK